MPPYLTASRALLVLAAAGLIVLTAGSAAGVRGSDQYWYVADVESIARGDGALTGDIFPYPLLRLESGPPFPPIHHTPLLYLVAPLAGIIGGYGAWLVLNVAWVLAAALLVRALLVAPVGEPLANLAAALFALMPASFWQASQPLADAWLALLVMICTWALCRPGSAAWSWPLACVALLVAALSREFFALPLLALPALYWRWSANAPRRKALWAATMLLLAAAALAAKGQLFPQQLEFSPATAWRQIASRVPGMHIYFDLGEGPPATLGELVAGGGYRFARALEEHLLPPWRQAAFYLPVNLLALVAMSGWLARPREGPARRLLAVSTGLLMLHALVLTTQHPSFRYGFVITGPLLVAAVVRLRRWLRPVGAAGIWLWAAVLAAGVAADLGLAAKNRREGLAVRELTAAGRRVVAPLLGSGEAVAFEAVGPAPGIWYLWAGHALSSSAVLYLDPGYLYDAATYERLRARVGVAWLICRRGSPLRKALGAEAEPAAWLPDPTSGWGVYRLPRPPPG